MQNNNFVRKGVIGELIVSQKLLTLGWEVFKNICDDNGIDLICKKENKILTIQVKTSSKYHTIEKGRKRYGFRLGNTNKQPDYFICIVPEGSLIIPSSWNKGAAFAWYPESKKTRHKYIFNAWHLLEQSQTKLNNYYKELKKGVDE